MLARPSIVGGPRLAAGSDWRTSAPEVNQPSVLTSHASAFEQPVRMLCTDASATRPTMVSTIIGCSGRGVGN